MGPTTAAVLHTAAATVTPGPAKRPGRPPDAHRGSRGGGAERRGAASGVSVLQRDAGQHRGQGDRKRARDLAALAPAFAHEEVAPEVVERELDGFQIEPEVAQQTSPRGPW